MFRATTSGSTPIRTASRTRRTGPREHRRPTLGRRRRRHFRQRERRVPCLVTTDANGNYSFSNGPGTNTADQGLNVDIIAGSPYQIRVQFSRRTSSTARSRTPSRIPAPTATSAIRTASTARWLAKLAIVDFVAPQPGTRTTRSTSVSPTAQRQARRSAGTTRTTTACSTPAKPIARKRVAVELLDGNGVSLGTTKTDANGQYLFLDLDPAKYQVRVVASSLPAGFISSTGKVGSRPGHTNPPGGAGGNNTDHGTNTNNGFVTAPQIQIINTDILRADFGFFRPLSVGDFVWEDVDDNETSTRRTPPLVGFTVDLLDGISGVITSQQTVAGGKYLFTNLVEGKYQVRVATPGGYVSSTGKNGSAAGPFEPGTALDVDNSSHGTENAALTFAVGPVITLTAPGTNVSDNGNANLTQDFGLIQPLSIGDTVLPLDANNDGQLNGIEAGIAGVTINLRDGVGALLGTTTTNAQGGYLFTYLLPGQYRVEVVNGSLPGRARQRHQQDGSATGPVKPCARHPRGRLRCRHPRRHGDPGPAAHTRPRRCPDERSGHPPRSVNPRSANSNRVQDFGSSARSRSAISSGTTRITTVSSRRAKLASTASRSKCLEAPRTPSSPQRPRPAGGTYLFDNLIAGSYQVRVSPLAGYSQQHRDARLPNGPYRTGNDGESRQRRPRHQRQP